MKRKALWIITVPLVAGALVYVVNTILYLTPLNPVKAELLRFVYAIQHPFFSQNWHLFAPNPIRTNFVLSVRCRTKESTSPWVDVTATLLTPHHQSRLSPMGKLVRIPQNAVHMYLGRSSDEWLPLLCRRFPNDPVCRAGNPAMKAQREMAQVVLHRTASAVCDWRIGQGRSDAVQMQILIHQPPPWSQRHLGNEAGKTKALTLPWLPYQPGARL